MLRAHRPEVLAVHSAVCSTRGSATFAARRSVNAAKRGVTRTAIDETGGVESLMNQNFERAGYVASAPTAWLHTAKAVRLTVPCAPLRDVFALLKVERIDVMWLDVEGAEQVVLESLASEEEALRAAASGAAPNATAAPRPWDVSIGILVVEMRFNDVRRNRAIFRLLRAQGFELVRALSVWSYKILDCVFLRAGHFLSVRRAASAAARNVPVVPKAALRLLHSERRNNPPGINRYYGAGHFSMRGERYVVSEPESLHSCAVWRLNATDGTKHIEFVQPNESHHLC